MLDKRDQRLTDAMSAKLDTLYRARPYTKAIPFNRVLPGADDFIELWVPSNAMFELVTGVIRCDTAGIDISLCDSSKDNPFYFVMPPTTEYSPILLGPSGYRSLPNYGGAKLLLTNPTGTSGTVKGVLFGYEVTLDGYYR